MMRVARSSGTIAALFALGERLQKCRQGYKFVTIDGIQMIKFADGTVSSLEIVSLEVRREVGFTGKAVDPQSDQASRIWH